MPLATTLNVAVAGVITDAPVGCVVIVGATGAAVTVSVATVYVTVPALFVTTQRYCIPVIAVVVAAVV